MDPGTALPGRRQVTDRFSHAPSLPRQGPEKQDHDRTSDQGRFCGPSLRDRLTPTRDPATAPDGIWHLLGGRDTLGGYGRVGRPWRDMGIGPVG